jgi:uncharacterized cofD-like protein
VTGPANGATRRQPKVVAIGGGHGLAATLRAVRRYTDQVTAVVSTADDGGSSGRLRQLLPVVPPGDLRVCLVALADPDSPLATAFSYRYTEGELAGHALGNLVLAGLMEAVGDPIGALDEACRLLGVRGRVLPCTTAPVVLQAVAACGAVSGQAAVSATAEICQVSLLPADPPVPPPVTEAIEEADQIVLGPGSLFTSVLAAVTVPGIRDALRRSTAGTVYVCNLHPESLETAGFDVGRHLDALAAHGISVDVVLCDPAGLPVGNPGIRVVEADLATVGGTAHDPAKLASALSDLLG